MYTALITAAGSGRRMNLEYNKMFYKIRNKTLIEYTVDVFRKDLQCEEIILVISKEDLAEMKKIFPKMHLIIGGKTRQESVLNGLREVKSRYVLIHDGARPNLKIKHLESVKAELQEFSAVILCSKIKDSILVEKDNVISHYLNRDEICYVQTPQAFETQIILKAHEMAWKNQTTYLDDAGVLLGELKKKSRIVYGDNTNIKATTKSDLTLLEVLL